MMAQMTALSMVLRKAQIRSRDDGADEGADDCTIDGEEGADDGADDGHDDDTHTHTRTHTRRHLAEVAGGRWRTAESYFLMLLQ